MSTCKRYRFSWHFQNLCQCSQQLLIRFSILCLCTYLDETRVSINPKGCDCFTRLHTHSEHGSPLIPPCQKWRKTRILILPFCPTFRRSTYLFPSLIHGHLTFPARDMTSTVVLILATGVWRASVSS